MSAREPGKTGGAQPWLRDRLRRLRAQGKSHSGLAAALGIDPSRVSEIVRGDRKISASEVGPMSAYLGMSEGDVLAAITGKAVVVLDAQIDAAAADLASKMGDLHGGKWLVHIDHKTGFILIRERYARGDAVGNPS
jgi:transcriptional regulator with XRE-family HTH domain